MTTAVGRHLGLRTVLEDHVETWSLRVGDARKADRRRMALWYYGLPTLAAAPLFWWSVEIQGVGPLLSGVAVFTGLLFGMLVLVFNTGITLRKDGSSLTSAHDVKRIIADLRANITYAAVTAFALALTLVVAAALTPAAEALAWGWGPPVTWLFLHLGLTLMTILGRFRTAFNYITR